MRRGADILADAERRSRRAAVVIARTDAERLSVRLSKDVCEEKAREMKKGEREDRREVRCGGARLGIAIRNAAVAIADHSEATARIAISWRVLGQDFVRSLNVSSPHAIRIINTRISLSRKRFIPQLGVSRLLCRSALGLRTSRERFRARSPFPSPLPSPSPPPFAPSGWLIAESAA